MAKNEAFNNVVPYLTVDGGPAAIKFYEAAFGAECDNQMLSEDGRVMHASLKVNGGYVMLSDEFGEGAGGTRPPKMAGGTTVTIHLEYKDAEPAWAQAVAAGAEVIMPLETQFWGAQYGRLRDPFGHVWSIGGEAKPVED